MNWKRRIPELDGLRGIAILLVLYLHYFVNGHGAAEQLGWLRYPVAMGRLGWSGVDLLFVLSGFLIGGILLEAKDSSRYFQTFYIRRSFRILPLYFAVVSLFVVLKILFPRGVGDFFGSVPLWSYATFTQNIWRSLFSENGIWLGPT